MSKSVESERGPRENSAQKRVIDVETGDGGGGVEVAVISYGDSGRGTKKRKGEKGGDQTKEAHGPSRVPIFMLGRLLKEGSDVCALCTKIGSLVSFISAQRKLNLSAVAATTIATEE